MNASDAESRRNRWWGLPLFWGLTFGLGGALSVVFSWLWRDAPEPTLESLVILFLKGICFGVPFGLIVYGLVSWSQRKNGGNSAGS
ncbi:MAG: hypothetical protein ACRC8S_10465 [Fimbriiglobus sp.]